MVAKKVKEKIVQNSPNAVLKFSIKSVVAILIAMVFLFPIYWLVVTSLKTDVEIMGKTLTYFPKLISFDAWKEQFQDKAFLISLRNSVIIASLAMTISLTVGIPASYAMGRFNIPGKKLILLTFLITQMMPSSLLLTPLYLIFAKVNLLNSFLAPAMAVASGSIPFIIITLRPYFMNLSKTLDDAARIDGCNAFTSFLFIMLPTVKTGVITVLTISFLQGWNDLVYSMTFNTSAYMRPLTANIYKFMDKYGMRWNCIMAYGLVLVIPVVLAFIFLQKYIVGGMTAGAVKE
ncbi:carbohydrate ABC transporter permease [[Clostridium] fimetarium]|uniref:Multiple sugar transport system permease protein n=1 Tax=[Clostridium] fimetarium TaxID=99656 RepID=A0A1I0RMK2_9FIRM|nr:carbohydrate ABC transporter permease [[Clostridium] fimetarium]SEW42493.1 multiple sugar transport system permease protein [[Clostridium] fimetarium]